MFRMPSPCERLPRAVLAALLTAALLPSNAHAEKGVLERDVLLGVAGGVHLATTSLAITELATGKKYLALDSLGLVATVPVVIYTSAWWARDPSDVMLGVATAWGAAMLVKGAIDVVGHHRRPDKDPGMLWEINPMIEKGKVGMVVGGLF